MINNPCFMVYMVLFAYVFLHLMQWAAHHLTHGAEDFVSTKTEATVDWILAKYTRMYFKMKQNMTAYMEEEDTK